MLLKNIGRIALYLTATYCFSCNNSLSRFDRLNDFNGNLKYTGGIASVYFKRNIPIKYPSQKGCILKAVQDNGFTFTFYEGNGNWKLDGLLVQQGNEETKGFGNGIDEGLDSALLKAFQNFYENYLDSILVAER